jgi:Raf kinase inhibitor-like YbhB/YbcL family protein
MMVKKPTSSILRPATLVLLAGLGTSLLAGCTSEDQSSVAPETVLVVSSPAFAEGTQIPEEYTCDGSDISPPLNWSEPPAGTRSLALIMDDPDAPGGVFTHWVIFNLPAGSTQLPAAVPTNPELSSGALQGSNDFGRIGYSGPCPPSGSPHRYRFTLYAVDEVLELSPGAAQSQVRQALEGHVLAQDQLTGTYQK